MMKIDWKRKLTSRKFWAAIASFVCCLMMAIREGAPTEQTITGMIMAAASLIAYIIGEGLADSKDVYEITPYEEIEVDEDEGN